MKRYTFHGTIRLDGPLHIGSGGGGYVYGGTSDTDATVIRDSSGYAIIPGSSLRGAIRAEVGQLAPGLNWGELREDEEIGDAVKTAIEARRTRTTGQSRTLDERAMQDLLSG
jgi:CRISPR/Cas system CSM-associated protein Csm3 (group 7 of RAMP superfamily)